MKLRSFRMMMVAVAAVVAAAFAAPANAQIKFEFGGGDEIAIAYLESRGYTEVRVLANEIFQVRVEACKDGVRYRFKVRIDGYIFDQQNIGSCGAITERQAREILRDAGYRRIDVTLQDGRFIAFGCKQRDRDRIIMSLQGEIRDTRRVGSCEDQLSPGDVAAKLREQGFDRIDFTDNELPTYVAIACLGPVKFELEIDGNGEIIRERRIGRCTPAIDPRNVVGILEDLGYSRIELIDPDPPVYVAEACKDGKRVEISVDQWGRVFKSVPLGSCKPKLSSEEIVEILTRRGFTRINITRADAEGFTVEACYKGRNLRMMFNIYGDFVSERDRGSCTSRRVSEVLEDLQRSGLKRTSVFVEGCEGNYRIRIELNQLGDPVKRERIGRC